MSLYDWLLFGHVLTAFAAVALVVVFGVMLASTPTPRAGAEPPALLPLGRRLWDVGGTGTLVLGVALAIDLDAYQLWDGWILAAFALWALAGFSGIRVGMSYATPGGKAPGARGSNVGVMYGIMSIAVAALLIVMIYKPGA